MQFSIDDLPAPLGPMMARISPLAMSKLMSVSALTPPNDRLMPSTESRVSAKERSRVMVFRTARFQRASLSCSSPPLGGEGGRGGYARRFPLSFPLPLA